MLNLRIIYFFLLFHIFPFNSNSTSFKTSFLVKLSNHIHTPNNRSISKMHKPMEKSDRDFRCKYKCTTANEQLQKFVTRAQARFIDIGTNDSLKDSEMEPPTGKISIFNLLSGDEEGEEEDQESDDGDENVKEDDDVSDDDFNLFASEEVQGDKLEGTKDESFLKQYHRQPFRMHQMVFPLLLAYKLKFFTVIPLLLGSLVLLVGTTGVAGFFFALFAAALAIHSKSQEH